MVDRSQSFAGERPLDCAGYFLCSDGLRLLPAGAYTPFFHPIVCTHHCSHLIAFIAHPSFIPTHNWVHIRPKSLLHLIHILLIFLHLFSTTLRIHFSAVHPLPPHSPDRLVPPPPLSLFDPCPHASVFSTRPLIALLPTKLPLRIFAPLHPLNRACYRPIPLPSVKVRPHPSILQRQPL